MIGTAWAVRDSLAAHFVVLSLLERPVTYGKGTEEKTTLRKSALR